MSNNNEQRTFTYLFEIKSDGKQVAEIKRSVKDIDTAMKQINKTSADNITVTAKRIANDKEAERQVRKAITDSNKLSKSTQRITDYYKRMNSELSKIDPNLEVVNAQMKAGVSASSEQGKEIERLVLEYQRLRNQGDAAHTSMRNFRGVVQNVGWQLQDTAVQLQAGTDGLVVFSQQGSQIASAFGPGGAVLGAIIAIGGAIGGVLLKGLIDATDATEDFEDAQKSLNSIIEVSNGIVEGYKESLVELAKIDAELAKAKMRVGIIEANKALESLADQLVDITDIGVEGSEFADLSFWGRLQAVFTDSADVLSELSEELNISADEARQLVNATIAFRDTKNVDALRDAVVELSDKYGTGNKELNKYIGTLVELVEKGKDASSVYQDLVKRLDDLNLKTKAQNEESEKQSKVATDLVKHYQEMIDTFYMTEEASEKYSVKQKLIEANQLSQLPVIESLIDKYYDLADARDDDIAAEEQADRRRRALQKIEGGINTQRNVGNPFAAEIERFKRNKEEMLYLRAEAGEENLQEQARINQLLEMEQTRHAFAMEQISISNYQNIVGLATNFTSMMSNVVNMLSAQGLASMQNHIDNMNDAQKGMFILTQTVAAASALVNGIDLGMKMAAMFANPTLVGVGTALGAASAGAIMGTTLAGVFDKGGKIPAGQMGIVSEYGDELVNGVLVKGPARVTSREETANIMNQGNSSTNVNIIQNIRVSGNGDDALNRAMKRAAKDGAQQGYAMVQRDMKNGTGVRKQLMRSTGI